MSTWGSPGPDEVVRPPLTPGSLSPGPFVEALVGAGDLEQVTSVCGSSDRSSQVWESRGTRETQAHVQTRV